MFDLLAGILHLGQVAFRPGGGGGGGEEEGASIHVEQEEDGGGGGGGGGGGTSPLSTAAGLLGCEEGKLGRALCYRSIKTREETYSVPMDVTQVGG